MGFVNLVEEVFKLLPADMFPRKTEELVVGNRLMTFLIPLLGLRVLRHTGIICLFADNDDDFYLQSEDNQDLAPDTEI